MADSRKNQRKKAVVNARVQWTLASRVILHFFVFICAGAVFGIINQFLLDPFAGAEENLTTFLRQSTPMMLALICLVPIFVRDTLTLSNRVAGPIYNLRNRVQELADGETDPQPLKFRKGDFWDDLPELFNDMVARLQQDASDTDSGKPSETREDALVEA